MKLVRLACTSLALTALVGAFACTAPTTGTESTARASSAVFTNGGFETGTAGQPPPAPWTTQTFLNRGITAQTPQTFAGLNLAAGGVAHTVVLASATGPGTQPDAQLGAAAALRWPRFGNQCALVNQVGVNRNVNILSQSMTIGAGDVDPSDGLVHLRFTYAPVLENPGHTATQQPYYFVIVTDTTTGAQLYSDFNLSADTNLAWSTIVDARGNATDYTDWQLVDVVGNGVAMGDTVEVQFIAAGCSLGGHFGELYVDGAGAVLPGISVEGTAPAQVNAGANLTYSLTYKNGSASAETGVVITFATPTGTTFQSITPPAGFTCVTPAVGMTGTITCTATGPVAAGATGTLAITVNVDPATTGTIVEQNYGIASNQESKLDGPAIVTTVGCTLDAQCGAAQWCDISLAQCTAKVANGGTMPTDGGHVLPVLNGTCNAGAGALVCTSAVCDTSDNLCGYANGDGPCTGTTGGTVCRSGVCSQNGKCMPAGGCNVDTDCSGGDWCLESTHTCTPPIANGGAIPTDGPHINPTLNGMCTAGAGTLVCASHVCDTSDNDCGYPVGDGPCTGATGGTVCRSGVCSQNGKCMPAGGCNIDTDCTGGNWCMESTHACTPPIANGGNMPTDGPHTNPTLNGVCNPGAGTLVCASHVCDTTDNKCGIANGDPCGTDASAECRSGMCSTSGTCEPPGTCNVDGDCTGGNWCMESTHTCTPPIANGGPMPTDGPHSNPTLNGMCNAGAGTLVCASHVCDATNNECGYANGDGPCGGDAGGGAVCQSGACSVNGNCEPMGGCNVDGDCTTAGMPHCNQGTHTCVAAPVDAGAPDGGGTDSGTGADSGMASEGGSSDSGISTTDSGEPIDSGSAEDAAADATTDGAMGSDASPDASASADASEDASGSIAGGGLSCRAAPGGSRGGDLPWMALAAAGLVVVRRRRGRRPASSL